MELREKTEFCGPAEPKKHLRTNRGFSKVQGGLVPALGEFNVGAVANAANLWALSRLPRIPAVRSTRAYPGTARAMVGGRAVQQRQAVPGVVPKP